MSEDDKFMGDFSVIQPSSGDKQLDPSWKVYEVNGYEVYKSQEDIDSPILETKEHFMASSKSLFALEDIKLGDRILCPTFFGYEWATVTELDYAEKRATAENEGFGFWMEYDTDTRHCWVCTSHYNRAALAKVLTDITSDQLPEK